MAAYDITTLGSTFEYDAVVATFSRVLAWSDTRIIICWNGSSDGKGLVQSFDVNTSTGALTAIGSPLSIQSNTNDMNGVSIVAFDSTHFVLVWRDGTDVQVKARAFAIDGSGAISTAGAVFTLSAITNQPSACLLDSTHIVVVGSGAAIDGYAVVLTVNTGTWAITEAAATLEFDTTNFTGYNGGTQVLKIDSTHVLVGWYSSDAVAQVLAIDGSYVITTVGSQLVVTNTANPTEYIAITPIDNTNHFLYTMKSVSADGYAQVVEVNLSTYAVTNVGTGVNFRTGELNTKGCVQFDTSHVATIFGDNGNGYILILNISGSWVVTANSTLTLNMSNLGFQYCDVCLLAATKQLVGVYQGTSDDDGYAQTFNVAIPTASTSNAMFMGANF